MSNSLVCVKCRVPYNFWQIQAIQVMFVKKTDDETTVLSHKILRIFEAFIDTLSHF